MLFLFPRQARLILLFQIKHFIYGFGNKNKAKCFFKARQNVGFYILFCFIISLYFAENKTPKHEAEYFQEIVTNSQNFRLRLFSVRVCRLPIRGQLEGRNKKNQVFIAT